jgi:hypothetical protein
MNNQRKSPSLDLGINAPGKDGSMGRLEKGAKFDAVELTS